jgi:DHA2 family methylenomycin A resistance protein-like MFS transporter
MTAGVLATNLIAAAITAKHGPRLPMVVGQAVFVAGCLCLIGLTPTTRFGFIGGQLLLIGAGLGLTVPPMTSAVLGSVERRYSGVASGALNATRQAGSVIGVALYGSLLADPRRSATGVPLAFWLSAGLLLLGCILSWRCVAAGERCPVSQSSRRG